MKKTFIVATIAIAALICGWYGNYDSSEQTNPTGPPSGLVHVCRGCSWNYDAWSCRLSNRSYGNPIGRDKGIGFRLAHDADLMQ